MASTTPLASGFTVDRVASNGRSRRVTLEQAFYGLLILVAIPTRFWDLGSRALHHDESLHAYYSWLYATGAGYVHDPLMHGPFLFHANALVYALLGASDASSRFAPAAFGVVLVGLPYLLRGPRFLGRWGALCTSALFLVSPSMLYYSRYIRHDIYTVVGTLLLFICIMRYVEQPDRRWLIGGAATLAFLLTNHEIVFAIVVVFAAFLGGSLLTERLRSLVPLCLAAATGLVIWVVAIRQFGSPLPAIPWRQPTQADQLRFYQDVMTHPLPLGVGVLALAFLFGIRHVLRKSGFTAYSRAISDPSDARTGSVAAALRRALADRRGLATAFAVGAAIFVALFSSLLTNPRGLATGTIATDGTLLYWLGQQNVRRGDQPWFYYLLLMPQYELFACFGGGTATLLTLLRAIRRRRMGRRIPSQGTFFLFLLLWFLSIFAGLSFAGEKMPWLVTHIALPSTLLGAALIGELIERTTIGRANRGRMLVPRGTWLLAAALLTTGVAWFLIAAKLSSSDFVRSTQGGGWIRIVEPEAGQEWWHLAVPPLLAVALLLWVWVRGDRRRLASATLVALGIAMTLLQLHAAWRLAYVEGDIARDSLIYNTTTPHVTELVADLRRLSFAQNHTEPFEVWFNDCVAWPLHWYMRDHPDAHRFGKDVASAPDDAAVVLANETECADLGEHLVGYARQTYILRWHEPEAAIYRNFAIAPELRPGWSAWKRADDPRGPLAIGRSIASSLATLATIEGQQRVYRLVAYREVPARLMTYEITLYVRDDLVPAWKDVRYETGQRSEAAA